MTDNCDTRKTAKSDSDDGSRINDVDPVSRYAVGINLGTTNCAMCFVDTAADQVDTEESDWKVEVFRIPQWIDFGQLESRETLPSFHYDLTLSESPGIAKGLAWDDTRHPPTDCVGVLARDAGGRHPGRRISSAKSWLSHDGVDRSARFLPWHGEVEVARMSPVDASACYLRHLRTAWNHSHPEYPLEQQDVVITLPASFDEVARELTIDAAKKAGLRKVYLIEEPQAAFYAWIDYHRDQWSDAVRPGQLILVCDIGGGTTDLTLIRVRRAGNSQDQVQFHRVAVGSHLILGGDNMDLAVAKLAEKKLCETDGFQLPLRADQWDRVFEASRSVKELMLGESPPTHYTLNIASEGSKLLAGSLQIELTREEIGQALIEGFFPEVDLSEKPSVGESGFKSWGFLTQATQRSPVIWQPF